MLPEYIDRIRSWGYRDVRARQLQFNRQEICVAALHGGKKRPPRLAADQEETAETARETRERPRKKKVVRGKLAAKSTKRHEKGRRG
jgi:hypothetical protein